MDKNEIRAENISLICLLRTLKKNLWMITAAAAIFAMLVSLYADFVRKPVYRAGMTYAVTSRMSGYSTRNITAAKELASILTEVLDNRIVNDTIRASSEQVARLFRRYKGKACREQQLRCRDLGIRLAARGLSGAGRAEG